MIFAFNLHQSNPFASDKAKLISIVSSSIPSLSHLHMSGNYLYITSQILKPGMGSYIKIHKMFVSRSLMIPFADAELKTGVLNHIWMDTYGPFLRVTLQTEDNGQKSTNVYCLNYNMEIYGKIENIASGKHIISVRYVGRKLYLVTSQISNPTLYI